MNNSSSFTYNPNIEQILGQPQQQMPMQYNMPTQQQQMPMQYNMPTQQQQMPMQYNMPTQQQQMPLQYNMPPQQQMPPQRLQAPSYTPYIVPEQKYFDMNKNKKTAEEFKPTYKKKKVYWIFILKSILVYTLLILIMNHINMNNMICSNIPFTSDNILLSTTIKGILMAVLILIIQIFLH